MVFGHCGTRLVDSLHLEYGGKRLGFCGEQIALHIPIGDSWTISNATGERRRFFVEYVILDNAANQSERGGCRAVDNVAEKIELPRLRRTDEPGQGPRTAKITGVADTGEAGSEPGGAACYTQVAGHRETQSGSYGRAVDHRDHHLWNRSQQHRELMHPPQPLDPLLEALAGAALHRLDVAACAEATPGPGDDDYTGIRVASQALQCFTQGEQHCWRKCVKPIGPIEGQPGD